MKKKLFAVLMTLTLVLTYMPVLAFAEDEAPADIGGEQATSEQEETGSWWIDWYSSDRTINIDYPDEYTDISVELYDDYESGSPDLTYYWCKMNGSEEGNIIEEGTVESYELYLEINEPGTYRFVVTDGNKTEHADILVRGISYYGLNIGGVWYELNDATNEALGADAWGDGATGTVTIPATVTLRNGKTYPINHVYDFGPYVTGVVVPATVTDIRSLGYYWDNNDNKQKVPGFTVFGKTGSYAQTYAATNGFVFRDLEAEAEAARQGTPDSKIAKVKIKKPAAKKNAVTVKWTKLNKKQLKKSKATKYEVWVSTSKSFPAGATTKEVFKSKGKSSATVKGLQKKTKYFVKVRAIKYVGGVKHVGKWSSVKSVKTKK